MQHRQIRRIAAGSAAVAILLVAVPARADIPYFGSTPQHGSYWNAPDHDFKSDGNASDAYGMSNKCHMKKVKDRTRPGGAPEVKTLEVCR